MHAVTAPQRDRLLVKRTAPDFARTCAASASGTSTESCLLDVDFADQVTGISA